MYTLASLNSLVVNTSGSLESPVMNTQGTLDSPVMKTLGSQLFSVLCTQYWPGSHLGRPVLSSAPRGGGGGPPLCIYKQEVGTYIYSRLYTVHGAWADFIEVLQLLIWWESH
jgi:hypothetical protein